ncbi:MAG: tRNA lysidine(34) synthetase TilS [Candidatus Nomurabacteria bacterium]|jgi:tRNA(Ile)-lysidine synthase|nr:tRNA lysidine(34) synthetase TilS [Candidatus Nomurabacteria bacterium]
MRGSGSKYILAVSGGVDSVVMLDKVARGELLTEAIFPDDFIVAHFDHGIRGEESHKDAEFVRDLAAEYGVEFVLGEGNLAKSCNEELAREKRYEFLSNIVPPAKIVTAHHQDDLLETVVINLIRGTGWRGLAPMSGNVLRPLLNMTKSEIVSYAIEHDLNWIEDATNFSPNYFRNRVRDFLVKITPRQKTQLLELCQKQRVLRAEIEAEIKKKTPQNPELSRYFFTMLLENVAIEILREVTEHDLTTPQLDQLLLFIKTARQNKMTQVGNYEFFAKKREIVVTKKNFMC